MIRSLLVSLGLMAVAVLLFAGTILAVLNFQGRLDHESLKGTPLAAFFPASPAAGEGGEAAGADSEPAGDGARDPTAPPPASRPAPPVVPAAPPALEGSASRLEPAAMDALAAGLEGSRRELERREQALGQREADLQVREQELEARRQDVSRRQDELERSRVELLAARKGLAEERVVVREEERKNVKDSAAKLAEMRPEDAAKMLGHWLPDGDRQVVKIFRVMEPAAVGAILGRMEPKDAQRLFALMTR